MSGPQEEGQTDTKSKSPQNKKQKQKTKTKKQKQKTKNKKQKNKKHCLKRTRNSSRESSATIYELQKIMNIGVPLNVQQFKTYELKTKKHEHEGSLKRP